MLFYVRRDNQNSGFYSIISGIADENHRLISHFASVTFLKLQVEFFFFSLFLGSEGLSIPNLIGNMSISIGYLKSK